MENDLQTLLNELYEAGQINDASEQERSKKMLNLEPDTAQLMSVLVCSSRRKRLLEIGTSNGYSTVRQAAMLSVSIAMSRSNCRPMEI